jgi:hypothetical protein
MRKSVLRPGFFVTTKDPNDVVEHCSTVDYARMRAARLSKRLAIRLYVWQWDASTGYRLTRATAFDGAVYWHRLCPKCHGYGLNCDQCGEIGSIIDVAAPVERAGDSI